MSATNAMGATRVRAQRLIDERVTVTKLHEDLIAHVEARPDGEREPTDAEKAQIDGYRTRQVEIDKELEDLNAALAREQDSAKVSALVRAHLTGNAPGVKTVDGATQYGSMGRFALDAIVAGSEQHGVKLGSLHRQIVTAAGGADRKQAAQERLMRVSNHTLSSDLEGLQPEQHIAQILQVIDASRPIVASARRVALSRGKLTYPKITGKPVVTVQGAEKTEGGDVGLEVEMVDATASTYIGGGNLSWQAIEWSTPDALDLWFQICAADYALKTEQDAAEVLSDAAFANQLSTTITGDGDDEFAAWIAAVIGGAAEVYANSGAMADTVYMSPDMFYAASAVTSDSGAMLINAGQLNLTGQTGNLAGMRVVVSRGFGPGVAAVGDSSGFLVAETPGAPVQLRAVEPAIGGLQVGIIGAFEAVAVEEERFALISDAS